MTDKLSGVAARIRALLAKTVANGCSEAEAQLAFEKAHELLAKYQLSLSDLELRAEGTSEAFCAPGETTEIGKSLASAIAAFCDCKVYRTSTQPNGFSDRSARRLVYFGLLSDTQLAEWLTSALVGFIQAKALDYVLETGGADREDFISGAIWRLNQRLKESVEDRREASSSATGTALMVLKNQLVEEAWAKKNLNLRKSSWSTHGNSRSAAFASGVAAGDSASLHKPTSRQTSRLLPAK